MKLSPLFNTLVVCFSDELITVACWLTPLKHQLEKINNCSAIS